MLVMMLILNFINTFTSHRVLNYFLFAHVFFGLTHMLLVHRISGLLLRNSSVEAPRSTILRENENQIRKVQRTTRGGLECLQNGLEGSR
jgi:hypothetical protein